MSHTNDESRLNYIEQSARAGQEAPGLQHGPSPTVVILSCGCLTWWISRASQMNGCAFCLDMHVKEAKLHGEGELRLYHPGDLARVAAVHRQGTRRAGLDRGADPDRADRHLRRALCRGARAVQREGTLDAGLPRDGHQRLEPRQRGLPHHAWRARQGLRSGQGRACLSGRASRQCQRSGDRRSGHEWPELARAIRLDIDRQSTRKCSSPLNWIDSGERREFDGTRHRARNIEEELVGSE